MARNTNMYTVVTCQFAYSYSLLHLYT